MYSQTPSYNGKNFNFYDQKMQQNTLNNGWAKYEEANGGRNKSCDLNASTTKQNAKENSCQQLDNNLIVKTVDKDDCLNWYNRTMSKNKLVRIYSDLEADVRREREQNKLNLTLIQKEKEHKQALAKKRNAEMNFVLNSIDKRKRNLLDQKKNDTSNKQETLKQNAEAEEASKHIIEKWIKHQLQYHRDLDDQIQHLMQLKRDEQIWDLEFDRKIKEIQFEAYQRDQEMKKKTIENAEYLKQQIEDDNKRKEQDSSERRRPPSSIVTKKDLETFDQKERKRKQKLLMERNKDMNEQMKLHQEKLDKQKKIKAKEQEEEREISKKLERLEVDEITLQK